MKRFDFPDFYVIAYQRELEARLAPAEQTSQIARGPGGDAAAGRARERASSSLDELVILLGTGFCPEGYGVAWFEPIGAAPSAIERQKLPLKLLVAAELNADGCERHRILAAVYHLDAETAVARAVDPSLWPDAKLDASAVPFAPEIDQPEHGAEQGNGEGNSVHSPQPARRAAAAQPDSRSQL